MPAAEQSEKVGVAFASAQTKQIKRKSGIPMSNLLLAVVTFAGAFLPSPKPKHDGRPLARRS
jgi:hypothetical protein